VSGLGLRQLQDVLNSKADAVQREFIDFSEELEGVGKDMLEASGEERQKLREKQKLMRAAQQKLADEINLWRKRAHEIMHKPGKEGLRTYLNELLDIGDESVNPAIEYAINLLDTPESEIVSAEVPSEPTHQSAAGRLIERARTDYTLRKGDLTVLQREAIKFANTTGMALDDEILKEIETAVEDPDPIVKELVILTTIQLHRFRTMQLADLDAAHRSIQYLSRVNHTAVIPVLIEVLENRRSGFIEEEGEPVESDNDRSRMVALLRLVEWHTAEAKIAVQGSKFDSDPQIVRAAERALELFQEPWTGALKGSQTEDS
jgi:ElaB/YqjD/DUF883 family membrane-anchored ribosome-binding protein